MSTEVRWHYRFRNFSRAYTLLREALEREVAELNELEREGVIQRFEYTFELAWLTLKDRLEYDGVVLATVTPRNVIREAFAAKLITDGAAWTDMLTDRNLMSHTYDFARFETVIENIRNRYLALLDDLYQRFGLEALE
ncbi:MAG: nucleotidyltransferase [Chloroflexi bacterium]|nr:nucleotidyltransferase [Chloroflexota bacterium]MYD47801.1 nucleotidyltransferase [Chloroflexota bacterium]